MNKRPYRVEVREEGFEGAFIFRGIAAENKNEACAEGIASYVAFMSETEIAPLSAVAYLEK